MHRDHALTAASSVVRLNSAQHATTTIQKRTMTFGSLQPFSSKWWWIGAIRNTRLPVSLNDATWMMTDSASITKTPPTIGSSELLLGQDRDGAERAAQRQRADVAHEHLRRVAC